MSLTCHYEQLASSYTWTELSREVVIESKLKIPETVPKIDTLIGGNIQMGLPVISVNEDRHSLLITGTIYPEIFYTGADSNDFTSNHQRADYGELSDEQNKISVNIDSQRIPKEYGFQWTGDNGLVFEELVEFPEWHGNNVAEVKVIPKNVDFERSGTDRINFSARIVLVIQPTIQNYAGLIKDLVVQPVEKANISKEQITVEQLSSVKQMHLPVHASLLLPGLKPAISRVLHCAAHPYNVSWEYNRGKIYLKGILDISMVYIGLDDDDLPAEIIVNEWNRDSGNPVAFETHFDTEIPGENLMVVPSVTIANINTTVKSRREIQCQANLDCQVAISRIQSIDVVTGIVQAPGTMVDIQKGLFNYEEYAGEATGEISFELSAELQAGKPGADRILICQGQLAEPRVEAADGSAAIEANLNLSLLYIADGPEGPELHMARFEPRFNNQLQAAGMIDFPNIQTGSLLRIHTDLESLKAQLINERSFKISGRIKARLLARNPRTLSILEDCAEVIPVDPETRPSMLFYIVQPGDTLWKIARRYQTTVAQLVQSNQIANSDRIEVGRKLLIPKQAAG